tara:strand:- start:67 stop:612 length:546 start_codon:yes stop_codon:yes gene_type:complete
MARGLSSALKTELANQTIIPCLLVTLGFASVVRITNHYKDITTGGNTFSSSSHLLKISSKSESSEINVSNFQIELSAVDNTFVSTVLNNNVSNDEVTIDVGLLNSSEALIDTFNFDRGYIESFSIDTNRGTLNLVCTSHFSDFSRISGRITNNGSQQKYFSSDVGMEFAALTVQDILWGRK